MIVIEYQLMFFLLEELLEPQEARNSRGRGQAPPNELCYSMIIITLKALKASFTQMINIIMNFFTDCFSLFLFWSFSFCDMCALEFHR